MKGRKIGPLGASKKTLDVYRSMVAEKAFQHPIPYAEIDTDQIDAVVLPRGHAPG